jgi:hypothetical protein
MTLLARFLDRSQQPAVFGPAELNRRARAVVEKIDAETGDRRNQSARIARLYAVFRDIQQAGDRKAFDVTVWEYVKAIGAVVANRFYMGQWRRDGVQCAGAR